MAATAQPFGARILSLADRLAQFTDSADGLSCTYLTLAHRSAAAELRRLMQAAGLSVVIDVVGNVIGRLASTHPNAKTVIVGSHYDTVRNAGKYDGRLGILTGLVVAEHLHRTGQALPFHLELIAFSEEEGVRFDTPYIGSAAVAGRFDTAWLQRRDASNFRLADVIRESGLDPAAIPALARRREDLSAYLEVHIEQGPSLLADDLPVGIVTAIAGAIRRLIAIDGVAGHAGTVPMNNRHDAATAAAEIVLYVEKRCAQTPALVGTVGQLSVPKGAINVIPGRCELSLDLRAGDDAVRDAALADVEAEIARIARKRGVTITSKDISRTPAVACAPRLQQAFAAAVERAGVKPRFLMSGAGHDAVMFDGLTDVGMLFVRCGNGGISHSPLETVTAADADIGARVLLDTLQHLM